MAHNATGQPGSDRIHKRLTLDVHGLVDGRIAMRDHLNNAIENLLVETEERAVAEARRSVASTGQRYGGTANV